MLAVDIVVVVVIQFLSGVAPIAEMAGLTTCLHQLLALGLSTLLDLGHPFLFSFFKEVEATVRILI